MLLPVPHQVNYIKIKNRGHFIIANKEIEGIILLLLSNRIYIKYYSNVFKFFIFNKCIRLSK